MVIHVVVDGCTLELKSNERKVIPIYELFRELEKNLVKAALELNANNKSKSAQLLCLNRTTLVEKCRKYGFPLLPPKYGKNGKRNF